MSLLRESFAIFRRNPLSTAIVIFLIAAASMGQVVSLGSLYPILQILISDQPGNAAASRGVFATVLQGIGAEPNLTNLLILFVILGFSYSVLSWFADAVQGIHLRNFESAIRTELFGSLVRADWLHAKRLRHGEFLNVITREATQYKFVVKYALYTFGSFLQFTALLVYALYLSWTLTMLGMVVFGLGSLVLIPILRKANELGLQGTHVANTMSNRLVAALRSLKTVKALSLEPFLVRRLEPSFQDSASNYFQQGILASGQYAIMEIIAFVAISAMLYVGLNILGVPKPELFIILVLLFRALPQVRVGIDNYHRAYSSLSSVDAVRQHLSAARATEERPGGISVPHTWSQIEFRNISFAYEDGGPIVNDLSVRICRREFWAVVGPSGSGKTTVLDILLGLLKPRHGTVTIDDIDLNSVNLSSWHRQLAYLGQEAFAFAGTLRENLIWGTDSQFRDSDLVSALRAVKLDEALDRDVGENGCNLSGGEKQRLALARLFLRHPALLILDEPTTGLDAATEKDIFESILTFFKDTTLVVVTHREELTRGADHIIRFSTQGVTVESRRDVSVPPVVG